MEAATDSQPAGMPASVAVVRRRKGCALSDCPPPLPHPITDSMDKKIGFIGAGQMAEALARGLIAKGVVRADQIYATDPMAERREVFRSFGTNAMTSNVEVRVAV